MQCFRFAHQLGTTALLKNLAELQALAPAERLRQRYAKFRRFGAVTEREPAAA